MKKLIVAVSIVASGVSFAGGHHNHARPNPNNDWVLPAAILIGTVAAISANNHSYPQPVQVAPQPVPQEYYVPQPVQRVPQPYAVPAPYSHAPYGYRYLSVYFYECSCHRMVLVPVDN